MIHHLTRKMFSRVASLISVNLSHNRITSVQSLAFESCTHLQQLDLGFNRLFSVGEGEGEGAFQGFGCSELVLTGNNLSGIATESLPTICRKASALNLDLNPWHCGCGSIALREWLVRSQVTHLYCYTPHYFRGRNLVNLTPSELCQLEMRTIGDERGRQNITQQSGLTINNVSDQYISLYHMVLVLINTILVSVL